MEAGYEDWRLANEGHDAVQQNIANEEDTKEDLNRAFHTVVNAWVVEKWIL